jgi:ammonia channel protein AmtB
VAIGAIAGVLLLVGVYVWEQVLHWHDTTVSAATFGLPGLWGLLALAIFADGRWGAGWNSVGEGEYLGIAAQGISGLLLANGYQPAEGAQLQAQLVGLVAVLLVGLVVPWVLFRMFLWLRTVGQSPPRPSPAPSPALAEVDGESDATVTAEMEGADGGDGPAVESPKRKRRRKPQT